MALHVPSDESEACLKRASLRTSDRKNNASTYQFPDFSGTSGNSAADIAPFV